MKTSATQIVIVIIIILALFASASRAATVHVGEGLLHPRVADAVAAAEAGDTIVVVAGVYREHGIEIVRPVTIIADGGAVIDGENEGEIITIRSDDVIIDGLVLRNVGTSFMEDRAAIHVSKSRNCTITRCRIENAFFGIYLAESYDCSILDNTLAGEATREVTSGNGVHLWYCRNITVTGNTIIGHRDGIYFEFVEKSHIENNTSQGNLRYGLHFMFSHDDEYVGNRFIDNGAGVAVMYSHNVTMKENLFEHNWGSASYGILLKEIRDSEIAGNAFVRNTIGAYTEGSNRLKIHHNDFVENGYGIKIMANSMDNEVTDNNFIGNTFDVTTNSRQNFNSFRSNYWSEYRGYDLDRDGVGDVPYHPVRLFALIVEKQPPGMLLLNSLFVRLIDTAERVMPVFTPETLVDAAPRIEAVAKR